jgi:hypothetical protein
LYETHSRIRLKGRIRRAYKNVFPLLRATAMDSETNGKVHPCVEVVEACGEWHVRVVDGEREKT